MDSEIEDHITEKFNVKKLLGKGAYGFVWKVEDKKSNEIMALKKIFDAFRNKTDAQRTYREIVYLREFGHHPNIIKLINVFKANNSKDIYLMFEFMESDLHSAIRKNNILEDVHKKYIMYQLFKAMKYLHSAKVIHRDLKPSNVLLNRNCLLKVCDFGLARSLSQIPIDEGGSPNLTEYVATRWYRAPEILLASHRYTTGVDQWSLGCILGEMLLGKALFQGSSTLDQLEKILSVVEKPSRKDIENIHSNYGATILQQKLKKPHSNLQSLLPNVNYQAISLIRQLLHINPDKRISADHALKHPYVKQFHNPIEEIVAGKEVVPLLDDSLQLSLDAYRSKLYEMIDGGLLEMKQNQTEIVESTKIIDKETTNDLSYSTNPNEMSCVHQDAINQDSGFSTQRITSQGRDDNEIQSEDNVDKAAEEIDHQSKLKELETKGENHSTGPTQQNLDVKSDEKISKSIEQLSLTKTKPNIKVKRCEVLQEKSKRKEPLCENDKKSLGPLKSNKVIKQQSQPKLNNPPFGSNKSQTIFSSKSYKLPRLEPSTQCSSTTQSKGDLPKLKPNNSSKELTAIYGTRAPSATLQDSATKLKNRVPFRHASAPASSSLNQFKHKLNYPARCPITEPTIPKAIGIPNKVQKRSTKVCWETKCIK